MGIRAHLVSGATAGGSLKGACQEHGLVGEVFSIDDDLSVGPLESDVVRQEWWKPIFDLYMAGLSLQIPGLEQQWRAALAEIFDRASEVVIWSSDSANDQIHLRLAALKLADFAGSLHLAHAPTTDNGLAGVSRFYPDQLAAYGLRSRSLDSITLAALARDYQERLDHSEGVRFQTDKGLELRDYSAFDEVILEACPREFQELHRVIGLALSRCDVRNWPPDMFLRWRLRLLVDAGAVQSSGECWFVDTCDVRVRR